RDKSAKAAHAGRASAQRRLNERSTNAQRTVNHTDTDIDTEKKEGLANANPKKGTRFTLEELPQLWRDFCQGRRPDLNPDETFAAVSDFWKGVPGAKGLKLDWFATWRNWVRSQKQQGARPFERSGDSPKSKVITL